MLDCSDYIPLTFEAMMKYLHNSLLRLLVSMNMQSNHRELLDIIDAGGDPSKRKKGCKKDCENDLNNMISLMSSYDVNNSDLHADGNAFFLNINKK